MSGLFSSLNAAANALGVQSRAVETAGKNLANVNNPAYARQRVHLGSLGTIQTPQGPESMGVTVLGLEQMRDALLDKQVLREISLSAGYAAEQQGYQRASAGLGQGIDGTQNAGGASSTSANGVAAALDDFFNAFQSLASNPTDAGQRQTLLQSASILTDRLRLADRRLTQVSSDLDAQIGTDVGTANRLLSTIAGLNAQIARLEINNPGSAVDLRDQRQADLEQLAATMPVDLRTSPAGQVQLYAKDTLGNDVLLVDGPTVLGPVAFNGTQVTGGAAAAVLALSSGSIQGALTARDGAARQIRDSLDRLAAQLVGAVNAAYNPTAATGDFFAAGGATAGTIAIAAGVNTGTLKASDGGAAGDNTVALAIARIATRKFSTAGGDAIDGTLGGYFSAAVSNLGQAVAGATARVADQDNVRQLVTGQRDSASGVSLDEETADLLKYQRAFQASARVFTTIDSLLDTVVNRLGA
ncbi:MAG: flagellar hook-associated protein FlgK [Opitutae bacterium]|nr:flagellar hook-associated protein FlgK [Opitutae bacterium]